jgi:BolA family transcriptional regulator, general stress-responsive regulator
MLVAERIRTKLERQFSPILLDIFDESGRHVGHAGAREGGESHFRVKLVAAAFSGKGRVERQRMVYRALAEELAGPVHALALTVLAPGEVEAGVGPLEKS